MLFVIDIGNTHTVAGIFNDGRISRQWRIKTDPKMTADELGISYHNLFAIAGVQMDVKIGRVDQNLSKMSARLEETRQTGAELTIFPECSFTTSVMMPIAFNKRF